MCNISGVLLVDLDVDKLEKSRAVLKYIGKNKVAAVEDYDNRDTIVSETIAMIRLCEKKRR